MRLEYDYGVDRKWSIQMRFSPHKSKGTDKTEFQNNRTVDYKNHWEFLKNGP